MGFRVLGFRECTSSQGVVTCSKQSTVQTAATSTKFLHPRRWDAQIPSGFVMGSSLNKGPCWGPVYKGTVLYWGPKKGPYIV